MTDLEDRLRALADAIDVPPTSPHDDLVRGRRRRRRHQWAISGGVALAAASVVVALAWSDGAPRAEPVGPADRSSTTGNPTVSTEGPEVTALEADEELHDLLVDRLGLVPAGQHRVSFQPSYDRSGRVAMLVPSVVVRDDRTGEVGEVSARVSRSWGATEWREFSCYPGCATYELDGSTVEVGRYANQWGWATERDDGTVVVLLLPRPAAEMGIEEAQVGAVLRDASLPDAVDEAAAWHATMLERGLWHFMVGQDSVVTGELEEATGPTVVATSSIGGVRTGEVRWEGELLTTAPVGCPDGFRCQVRDIEDRAFTFKWVEGGEHDGRVWVEHDGRRVRSRVLIEPWGLGTSVPLERVAGLLTDPFWQDLPAAQSVTTVRGSG
jgi:hypothetical protein